MIKAIIWDVGGVLIRTEDRRPRTMLADMLGLTYEQIDYHAFNSPTGKAAQRGEITYEAHWNALAEQFNLRPDEIEPVQTSFWGGDVLDRTLIDYIKTLHGDYSMAILSNYASNLRPELTDKWKIADLFDPIFISCELGMVKPNPAIFRHAVDTLGIAPDEAVFIDDFRHNVQGAQAAGLHALQFLNTEQIIDALNHILEHTSA
jgi:epoxide hydrolase-like predicted phosphatase